MIISLGLSVIIGPLCTCNKTSGFFPPVNLFQVNLICALARNLDRKNFYPLSEGKANSSQTIFHGTLSWELETMIDNTNHRTVSLLARIEIVAFLHFFFFFKARERVFCQFVITFFYPFISTLLTFCFSGCNIQELSLGKVGKTKKVQDLQRIFFICLPTCIIHNSEIVSVHKCKYFGLNLIWISISNKNIFPRDGCVFVSTSF